MPTLAFMAYSAAANQAGTLLDWLFSGKFERFAGPQDRAVGGIHRLDPVLPGAGRAGGRQAAVLGLALRHRHEPQPRPRRGRSPPPRSTSTPTCAGSSGTTCSGPSSTIRPGIRLLDVIGEDNVMLECDYPHSDSTWPDSVQLANKWLAHLPEDVQHKIAVGNATRVYGFTPGRPGRPGGIDVDVRPRSRTDDPARRGHQGHRPAVRALRRGGRRLPHHRAGRSVDVAGLVQVGRPGPARALPRTHRRGPVVHRLEEALRCGRLRPGGLGGVPAVASATGSARRFPPPSTRKRVWPTWTRSASTTSCSTRTSSVSTATSSSTRWTTRWPPNACAPTTTG